MGRRAGFLLPGLPQLLRGSVLGGGFALFLWLGLLTLAVTRFDRVRGALLGDLDDWIALLTLAMVLGGVWLWSFRAGRRSMVTGRGGGEGSPGALGQGWRAFRRNRMALLGLGIICLFYLAMLLTPFLAPFEPEFREAYEVGGDMTRRLAAPSSVHLMGTDEFSQDILSRILYGARISLTIGLLAVGISVTLWTFLWDIAG